MKFVALLSGGKDSIYATLQAIENGHELICCAHLAPSTLRSNPEEESYMYQTAGSEAVRLQAEECMGVPLHVREIHGRSKNTALVYETFDKDDSSTHDEVEDLYLLLKEIQMKYPDISAISSGAILSTYQRTRIENVCSRLNLTSLSYLWRMSSQRLLLDSILDDGQIDAVLVRVACPPGLMPYKHLGKSLRDLRDKGIFDQLNDRYGMNPAGEGGEYETLVLDCPKLFKGGRLVLEETVVVCDESDDGVGILKIIRCSVEKKKSGEYQPSYAAESGFDNIQRIATDFVQKARCDLSNDINMQSITSKFSSNLNLSMNLPTVRVMKGGLCHISAILSPIASNQLNNETLAAVQEFLIIQQMLLSTLLRLFPGDLPPTSAQDVVFVHLYLSEMSHFAKINQYYRQLFGTHLPPSRACVAVGKGALPGGRRVMMDCILQRGSGAYMRNGNITANCDKCNTFFEKELLNKHNFLRKTLHVQSISRWAPVCIGPYSQANSLRSSIVLLAGMIGLVPQSMTLIEPASSDVYDFEVQLCQCWQNAAAVLDGLEDGGGKLEDCLGGLVYVSIGALKSIVASAKDDEDVPVSWQYLWNVVQSISSHALSTNAGFVMGSIDGIAANNPRTTSDPNLYDEEGVLYGGYEDEETWREMSGSTTIPSSSLLKPSDVSRVPLLMICLPELPANAAAEVELILASRRAASCLDVFTGSQVSSLVQNSDERYTTTLDLNQSILWDTGYDHTNPQQTTMERVTSRVEISSIARFVGRGCACVSTIIAKLIPCNNSLTSDENELCFDLEDVLSRMIDTSINNSKGKNEMSSLFTIDEVLNVRLYYVAASVSRRKKTSTACNDSSSVEVEMKDDGSSIRTQLHSVLQQASNNYHAQGNDDRKCRSGKVPAYTVVPVLGMELSGQMNCGTAILAMQVTMADMIRMETEIWVRHNRQYEYDK